MSSAVTNLSSFLPFLISGNVRLRHRYPTPAAVDAWVRNSFVRRVGAGEAPPSGAEGDLVLGELHSNVGQELRVMTQSGSVHVLPASDAPRPVRVLAVLGSRDSSLHCNGGLFDQKTGVSVSSIPLLPGSALAWLGEESGIVGHLMCDAGALIPLSASASTSAGADSTAATTTTTKFVSQASVFVLLGAVYDASTGAVRNIRSLSPPIPHASASSRVPRLILVGSTSSSAGKSSLACQVLRSLHALAPSSRLAFVKLTGSGSLKDTLQASALRSASGAAIVVRALDHVDVGLVSTYALSASAPAASSVLASSSSSAGRASGGAERLKSALSALLSLAAEPVDGAEVDFVVGELGSDLIWAGNPITLAHPLVVASLLGMFVLARDALSVLGACQFLHGTLQFPPEKLVLVLSHAANHSGVLSRIRGSQVQVYRHDEREIHALVKGLLDREAKEAREKERAQTQQHVSQLSSPPASTVAAASAAASPSASPSPASSSGSPAPGPLTHLTVTVFTPSASPTTVPQMTLPSPEKSFELDLPAIELPAPSDSPLDGKNVSFVCRSIVDWVLDASSLPAGAPLEWNENEVAGLILSVSRSPSRLLQTRLNYQFQVRRRDRLRAKRAKEAEARAVGGDSEASAADSAAPTSAVVASLLSLGDYSASPFYIAPAPVALPAEPAVAAALLELDPALAHLRLVFVPARVSEDVFWTSVWATQFALLHKFVLQRHQAQTKAAK